jgi:hypothetical protein
MRVRYIGFRDDGSLTNGKIYSVIDDGETYYWGGEACYYIVNNAGNSNAILAKYCEIVPDNLLQGWRYCKCGTITKRVDCCCGCQSLDTSANQNQ